MPPPLAWPRPEAIRRPRRASRRRRMQVGWPLKALRRAGTFGPPVAERIRAWGVAGTVARAAAAAVVVFALHYVLVIANPPPEIGGNWRTPKTGSARDYPSSFLTTILDGVTFTGLLFIIARGFSLIFGLMRVVNMAHGAFYLL